MKSGTSLKANSKEKISNIPVALAGIALGFMSLATAWVEIGSNFLRHIAVIFAIIMLLLIVLKIVFHPKKAINEMKHNMMGSLYPTISMTLMIIAVYVVKYNKSLGRGIWITAIIVHMILFFIFLIPRFKDFKFKDMAPTWFIPTVGIGVAAVTSGPMGFPKLSQAIFYYSFIWAMILLPIMVCRLLFSEKLVDAKKPTLAIMSAPACICLAAYLGIFKEPSKIMLGILVTLAYLSTLYVYLKLPKLIKIPFSPALAPLTFPLAIGVIATQRYVKYLNAIQSSWTSVFNEILYIQLIIATLVIGYIVYKTIEFIFLSIKSNKKTI